MLAAGGCARSAELHCEGKDIAPYPCSDFIRGIEFDWRSHQKGATGSDNWPLTWADDDFQYAAWGDGHGWSRDSVAQPLSFGVSRISMVDGKLQGKDVYLGAPQNCADPTLSAEQEGRLCGKSYGVVALDSDDNGQDELYLWLSPGSGRHNTHRFSLYYSRDYGASWHDSQLSFHRKEDLMLPTFIQFGQSYQAIKATTLDPDFVYFYAIQPTAHPPQAFGLGVQKPGSIYLIRVARRKMAHKGRYQYYTGNVSQPWSENPGQKKAVFRDQRGVGWNLSAIYLPRLKRYFLMTEHQHSFQGRMGLFESARPWGPWKTVAYYSNWAAATGARADADADKTFFWNFSPKWTGHPDKSNFVMAFTGVGDQSDSFNMVSGKFLLK